MGFPTAVPINSTKTVSQFTYLISIVLFRVFHHLSLVFKFALNIFTNGKTSVYPSISLNLAKR